MTLGSEAGLKNCLLTSSWYAEALAPERMVAWTGIVSAPGVNLGPEEAEERITVLIFGR